MNQNGKERKLVYRGSVCVVRAFNPDKYSSRIIGVYENEETAIERVAELRQCWVILENEHIRYDTKEVWGWDE